MVRRFGLFNKFSVCICCVGWVVGNSFMTVCYARWYRLRVVVARIS